MALRAHFIFNVDETCVMVSEGTLKVTPSWLHRATYFPLGFK